MLHRLKNCLYNRFKNVFLLRTSPVFGIFHRFELLKCVCALNSYYFRLSNNCCIALKMFIHRSTTVFYNRLYMCRRHAGRQSSDTRSFVCCIFFKVFYLRIQILLLLLIPAAGDYIFVWWGGGLKERNLLRTSLRFQSFSTFLRVS